MRRLATTALLAPLLLGACFLQRRPVPPTTQGEWARARDGATRRQFLYDRLDHRATVTATHLSLAVREARARRLGVWFDWTPEELQRRLAQERQEAAEGEEFLVVMYTAQPKENDLDAPRPVWRVAVKVDGADVLARRVTSIDRDATVTGLFPFVGQFDVVYRAMFPPAPGGPLGARPFTLELSSALGQILLVYEGRPAPGPAQPEEPRP